MKGLRVNRSFCASLWLVSIAALAPSAAAHDLTFDELVLFWEPEHGLLRGQITWNPHRNPREGQLDALELGQRVMASLERSLEIDVDGRRCPLHFEVRELWVRAGATLGDVVMLRCEPGAGAREFKVFADRSVDTLVISIQRLQTDGTASTHSVLLRGGHWTPPYRVAAPSWAEGGPGMFTQAQPAPTNAADGVTTGNLEVARNYLVLGVRHILDGGWDHIAFVAALMLGSGLRLRAQLWQLSAFTLAHSLTLALGALGWVLLSRAVVEPLIALSIVWVALTNLIERSADTRGRAVTAFCFGLLHGQGFASGLIQTGLPHGPFIVALLSFNVGVELGQISVAGGLWLVLRRFEGSLQLRRIAVRSISLALALLGLWWTIRRLA
jgi:hypothetical protein